MLDLIKYESSVGYLERSAEVIYELAELVEVVTAGLREVQEGKVVSQEEARERLKK